MKTAVLVRTIRIQLLTIFVVSLNTLAPVAGQPSKLSAPVEGEPDALLAAAMKEMGSGVWTVKGTVTVASKKTINLQGLLSGEDFDLSMEPGVKPDVPLRGIV